MEIPSLDLKAQYSSIKDEVNEALRKVLDSQYFILSEEVGFLEKEVSGYCGTGAAVGVASGTDALVLALKALGIGKGDAVLTSPFTFFATAESISILDARPVFADIDPDTYNIDPEKIREVIEGKGKEDIKAIMPVHLYGQCAEMDKITEIAREYGLYIVEDAAQAIGASYNGKKAGSFGEAGCLSFFPSKNLGGFGDGGMVVSSDREMETRLKKLRVHGSASTYIHDEIGYNSRLDSLQAAILRVKLKSLDEWLEKRRDVARKYDLALGGLGIKIPVKHKEGQHTFHQYTLSVENRDELLKFLNNNGIAARVYYPVPLHLQPCYDDLGYSEGSFPVTEAAAKKVLSIPIYPELTDEQIRYITDTIKIFFNN